MIPSYFDGKNKDDLNLKKGLKIFVNNYLDNNPIIDPNSTNKFQKKKKFTLNLLRNLKKLMISTCIVNNLLKEKKN